MWSERKIAMSPTTRNNNFRRMPLTRSNWLAVILLLLASAPLFAQYGNPAPTFSKDDLKRIEDGFRIFTTETFDGNGRSCGTCHLPEKNYNITPADIAQMTGKQRDLVFAKNVPELENETLVRKLAIFNINEEHAPGNGDASEGPFRASMSIAGLGLTTQNLFCTVATAGLVPLSGCPQQANNEPVNDGTRKIELGWSGDGAMIHKDAFPDIPASAACRDAVAAFNANPNDLTQTLRAFALTAVKTHNPRSLNRVPGVDFRCPTPQELDAIVEFQKWLGRRFELDLAKVTFTKSFKEQGSQKALAEEGKNIFMGDLATCNRCHVNAGSSGSLGRVLLPEDAPPAAPAPPIPGANKNSHSSTDLLRISEVFLNSQVSPVIIPRDAGDKMFQYAIPD
jgi:hypothetical protein